LNTLAETIEREMAGQGIISFARFMELALYCPDCGYYEKEKDTISRRGDFYTSVSVGSLFGELLAFQFAEWLAELRDADCGLRIIEAGAHDGQLARDILRWLREQKPEIFDALEFCIIEPSGRRRQWQRETLGEFLPRMRWLPNLPAVLRDPKSETRNPGFNGIIFSNELLDAMPVQRFGWDAHERRWFEWGVGLKNGRFVWSRMPFHASRFTLHVPSGLSGVLPDGYCVEVSPAAESWWREAATLLERGELLTIDYGFIAEEFFAPERKGGTLRAYHRHRLSDDVLENVGEQDITAHVNFSAIQAVGEAAGLRTEMFQTQARVLTDIAQRAWKDKNTVGPWTAQHTRQFQTLTHPEHLGCAFRFLVQSR
jgi:SAM-dependent MidA family methyltransferase